MTRRLQGRMGALGYAGVAGALFLLSGCADWDLDEEAPDAQYAAVCVDQATGNRLDDDRCGDWDDDGVGHAAGTYFLWMPMSSGNAYLPPVGQHIPPGTPMVRTVPPGTPVAKGAPTTGGKVSDVQRGGFGVKSGTAGGSKAGAAGKAGSGSGGKSGGS